jgi:hypothetical protein
MMRPAARLRVAVLGLALVAALDASAQEAPQALPDAVVRKMIELGLQNIQRATCDGFNDCAPASPSEFEFPPLTLDQARSAMLVGTRTALAHWCGLDADRRSLLPMTRHLRKVLRFNERQMALAAIIHGIQQSAVAEQLKARGPCDAATRSKMDAQLPKT